MQEANWRDAWSRFRVNLVDETARCLADPAAAPKLAHLSSAGNRCRLRNKATSCFKWSPSSARRIKLWTIWSSGVHLSDSEAASCSNGCRTFTARATLHWRETMEHGESSQVLVWH